jgi:hypothetical protein
MIKKTQSFIAWKKLQLDGSKMHSNAGGRNKTEKLKLLLENLKN